jgi:ABC-type transport system involved in multi-copper enzyme maturation permease subunit
MGFVLPIARFTLVEAFRNRMLVLAGLLAVAGLGVAAFIEQVALTETAQIQSAIIAAVSRVCAVFLLATFVVASVTREYNDKVVELVLSQPLPRWSYVIGKFGGFAASGVLLAIVFSLPLLLFAPLERVLIWSGSLALELILIAALSLFCVLTLTNVMLALAAVGGFYVLARSIGAIQVIASASSGSTQPSDLVLRHFTELLALLLPNLDRVTQAAWLTDPSISLTVLAPVGLQAGSALILVLAASMFDFYRQNF